MKKLSLFLLVGYVSLFAQTDLIYPWVTNNSTFPGQVIVNNLNGETVTVTLTATRADGTTETSTRDIDAYAQLVSDSVNLFPTLGAGSGYAVQLTSDASNIKGALVVTGTQSSSGSSPAQADVLESSSASTTILYNFLPLSSGFSAPVVVNMGDATAQVTFHAFQDGFLAGTSDPIDLEPSHPFAALTTDLFPDLTGEAYLVAEGDQNLVGMSFIFNDQREPSMSAATAISAVPEAPPVGVSPEGVFDVDAIKGEGFSNQKVGENLDEFIILGGTVGIYAFSAGVVLDWTFLSGAIGPFFDGDIANGEALNVILDYTATEEVNTIDPGAGTPSGTGTVIGGAARLVADDGTGVIQILYLNIPTVEGMDLLYDFFELPPR